MLLKVLDRSASDSLGDLMRATSHEAPQRSFVFRGREPLLTSKQLFPTNMKLPWRVRRRRVERKAKVDAKSAELCAYSSFGMRNHYFSPIVTHV